MIFRLAKDTDIPLLIEMRWLFKTENKDISNMDKEAFFSVMDDFLQEGLNKAWFVWVAETDGRIVSNAYVHKIVKVPKPNSINRKIGYVTNVFTKPKFRNSGIGDELMGHVKKWAKDEGYELMFLWPSEKAKPFYKRLGFDNDNEMVEWVD